MYLSKQNAENFSTKALAIEVVLFVNLMKLVYDRTAKNVVRPNPNGSAEQFGRTLAGITPLFGPKIAESNCKM